VEPQGLAVAQLPRLDAPFQGLPVYDPVAAARAGGQVEALPQVQGDQGQGQDY
jgi:hypothetical protein